MLLECCLQEKAYNPYYEAGGGGGASLNSGLTHELERRLASFKPRLTHEPERRLASFKRLKRTSLKKWFLSNAPFEWFQLAPLPRGVGQ